MVDVIKKARYKVAQKMYPYLSDALFSMQLIPIKDFPTMGVDDKWRCYYSEETVEKWGIDITATVLIHEVWHLLRKHHKRRGNKLQWPWNEATDREINDDIKHLPFPFEPCLPEQINKPNNLLAEEYYQEDSSKQSNTSGFGGSCADGIRREWEHKDGNKTPDGEEGINEASADLIIKKTAQSIKNHAKSRGNIPNGIQCWADSVIAPAKVDYRRELKARLSSILKRGYEDTTYSRINRRRNSSDIVFPGSYSIQPSIAVILDTSGSMIAEGNKVLSEVNGVLKSFDDVKIISADAEIHNIQKVKSVEQICALGGGGTSMKQAIEDVDKMHPDVILTITDGYTDWNERPTRAKQVTLLTEEGIEKCPFGVNIYV